MKCVDLEALLCDYVDGALEAAPRAEVERHLQECSACAALAADAAAAVRFIERAAPVEPPPELITRILYALPAAKQARKRQRGRVAEWLGRLLHPMLQPRFAMGFAMTILSFSMLGRFTGVLPRQLTPADLNPVKVWQAIDDRVHRAWDRSVKFYESLRLVWEVQTRIREWNEQEQQERKAGAPEEAPAAAPRNGGEGTNSAPSR